MMLLIAQVQRVSQVFGPELFSQGTTAPTYQTILIRRLPLPYLSKTYLSDRPASTVDKRISLAQHSAIRDVPQLVPQSIRRRGPSRNGRLPISPPHLQRTIERESQRIMAFPGLCHRWLGRATFLEKGPSLPLRSFVFVVSSKGCRFVQKLRSDERHCLHLDLIA